ncbi:MAG TPA: GNAT family N-acetyltransferase [Jatrophihabitantaceae bacterium]
MRIEPVDFEHPDAVKLCERQRVELAERYGRPDSEPGGPPSADEIRVFLIARDPDTGEPVGCGGLRPLDHRVGEIKRMYVVPARRRGGVAGQVLRALERHARDLGWATLRLETGDRQPDAIAFYARHGYRLIPAFGVYAGAAGSVCFERDLSDLG